MTIKTTEQVVRTEEGDIKMSVMRFNTQTKNRTATTLWVDDKSAMRIKNALMRLLA